MKRILTLIAVFAMTLSAMAQNAGILLSYDKGRELKFYRSNELAKAIEDAEVNDTLYFSAGDYDLVQFPQYENSSNSDHRQLTKPLVFIGAGAGDNGTRFTRGYNLVINIHPSIEESKRMVSFEGIDFNSQWDIFPVSNISELKFVNTRGRFTDDGYSDYYMQSQPEYKVDNMIIDRCNFYGIALSGNKVGKANIKNTKIFNEIKGGCSDNSASALVDHCYVENIGGDFRGYVQHSVISMDNASAECVLNDCYYSTYYGNGSSVKEDCKEIYSWSMNELDDNPTQEFGNCTDGTYYGTSGGNNPYTLNPSYPTPDVSEDANGKRKSFIDYDSINKNLTVTVTLLGDENNNN